MTPRRKRGLLIAAVALATGCRGGDTLPNAPEPPSSKLVVEPTGAITDTVASPAGSCTMPDEPPKCPWPSVEQADLEARIETLRQKVEASSWRDHASLVELTRLQLLASKGEREGRLPDKNGPQSNAKRSLAVDTSPPARLVAALALLHERLPRLRTAAAQRQLFALVEMLLRIETDGSHPAQAHANGLVGYHRLLSSGVSAGANERGEATPLGTLGLQLRKAWDGGFHARSTLRTYPELAIVANASDVPTGTVVGIELPPPRLAPPAPPISPCDPMATGTAEGQAFCTAAEKLARAPSRAAAAELVGAFGRVRTACLDGDPLCGAHVPEALVAASSVWMAGGAVAKAVSVLRVVSGTFPQHRTGVDLRLSDAYLAIGMFDRSADHAVRHARAKGWMALEAIRRALVVQLALGVPGDQIDWLPVVLSRRQLPQEARRRWVAMAAETLPAASRSDWEAQLPQDVRPRELSAASSLPPCDAALLCGYVAVLNDPSWSSASSP